MTQASRRFFQRWDYRGSSDPHSPVACFFVKDAQSAQWSCFVGPVKTAKSHAVVDRGSVYGIVNAKQLLLQGEGHYDLTDGNVRSHRQIRRAILEREPKAPLAKAALVSGNVLETPEK